MRLSAGPGKGPAARGQLMSIDRTPDELSARAPLRTAGQAANAETKSPLLPVHWARAYWAQAGKLMGSIRKGAVRYDVDATDGDVEPGRTGAAD